MRRNTSWAFVGNTAYAGCQWVVFVLLVKWLQLAEVGSFAYATAVTGPIFVLANLRLRNLLATATKAPRDFSDYMTARLLTTGLAVLVSIATGAIVSGPSGSWPVLALLTGGRACDALSDICHGLFQRELDMRSAAVGLMLNGVLSVVLVFAALALQPSLTLATAACAAGSCLALLTWDLPRGVRLVGGVHACLTVRQPVASGLRLIGKALPLGLSSAIGSVQSSLPRYVIASSLGPAPLAVFAALSYVPMLGHLVVNAASQAALPMLAKDAQTSRRQYRTRLSSLVLRSIACGALGLTATFLLGRPLLAWIYGGEYAEYVDVLFWLVAAAVASFVSVFLGTGTTARQRFSAQCLISATSLAIVAGTIGPLVSRHGLKGAAWSLIVGAVVELCAYAALTMRDLKVAERTCVVAGALAGEVRP